MSINKTKHEDDNETSPYIWQAQCLEKRGQVCAEDSKKSTSKHSLPEERNVKRPTNNYETLVHLMKGNTGAGMLATPEAFKSSGLWGGLIYTPILGVCAVHNMHLIVKASTELCKRAKVGSLDYERTAQFSFLYGPPSLRKYADTVYKIIMTFLVLTQLGFCCVYFVLISQNMYQAIECITGGTSLSQFHYMAFALLPILLICYIPDLKYLAPVSYVAFCLHMTGLSITFYYLGLDYKRYDADVTRFGSIGGIPHYFGIITYAFEGIGLILPLENNMRTPKAFRGTNGVLNTGMITVSSLLVSIAFFGYLSYGNDVMGSITLNLPGDELLGQTVKILISTSIFLTYPLQYYVPLMILLPNVTKHFSSKRSKRVAEYAFRTFLVLLTFSLAALIPNIGLFINLIGAVCSSTLAFIFPPLIDTITFWPDMGKCRWRLWKNLLIMGVGVLGFVTGAFTSIVEMIEFFRADDHSIELGC